ncbi:hypothetical protein ACSRBF_00510 [Acinetobacter baumannii]
MITNDFAKGDVVALHSFIKKIPFQKKLKQKVKIKLKVEQWH